VFSHGDDFFETLAAKRGNRLYTYQLRTKLELISEFLAPLIKTRPGRTNTIFFTGSDDNRGNPATQWKRIGEAWNLFSIKLRKTGMGRVLIVRSWESTKKGYPHVHALIVFLDRDFHTFLKWSDKESKMITRVRGLGALKEFWPAFIDIRGADSSKGVSYYITKEILKDETSLHRDAGQGRQTLALMWASGRRSFASSRPITEYVTKSLRAMRELKHPLELEKSTAPRPDTGPAEREAQPALAPARLDASTMSRSNSNSVASIGLHIDNFDRQKVKLIGIGRRCDVLLHRDTSSREGDLSNVLIDVPQGLWDPHARKAISVDERKDVILKGGGNLFKPDVLEHYQGDVYDELPARFRKLEREAALNDPDTTDRQRRYLLERERGELREGREK